MKNYNNMALDFFATAKKGRGQLFSSDMIAAVFIFLLMVSVILSVWNSSADRSISNIQRNDMEITAMRIIDILSKSPGYPADWEDSNAVVIGLADSDRKIDSGKLDAFLGMDYNLTRDIFGMPYNYFFKLGNYTKGINGTDSVFARRMVVFNGTQLMELTLSK